MQKNTIIKYSIFAGLWAVLLIPFLVMNGMFFPFISGKNFVFRIIIEIIFALWVYLAYVDHAVRPKLSWILKSVALFVLVMAFADFFAVAPMKAFWSNFERMDGWVTLIHLLMYLLVFGSMMKTEKIWLWFFRSSLIASIIMIFNVLGDKTDRVSVTFGNPIYVAIYFLFNFFFALILLYKDVIIKNTESLHRMKSIFTNWLTYIYLISAIASVYGIWRTGTRGVILGLLGGLIVTSLFIALFEKKDTLMKRSSIGVLIFIVVLVVGFLGIKNTQFVKNSSTLQRLSEISWSNVAGQGQARQYVWPMAIEGFKEKPILGWGQDGFNYVFNKYYDPRMYSQEQWFDRAHNMPLDMLVAGGALGLITYLLIFISAIYLVWKRRNILSITEAGLIIGLLAGYFFQNLFVFDNLTSYIFFFVTLSYIHAKDVEDKAMLAQKNSVNYEKANYMIAPLLIIILGGALWYANIRPINANVNLINAIQQYPEGPATNLAYFKKAISYNSFANPEIREQLLSLTPQILSMQIDNSLKQDFGEFTLSQIEAQLNQTPNDARYQLFTGIFFDNIGQYAMAESYLRKAVDLSPKKQTIIFELIKNLAYQGKKEEALMWAKKAYEFETDFPEAKNNYIAMAILNNQNSLAQELMGNATTTTSQIIIRAYLLRAEEFLKKGDKNSAIAEIQKAMKIAPSFKEQGQQVIAGILNGTIK